MKFIMIMLALMMFVSPAMAQDSTSTGDKIPGLYIGNVRFNGLIAIGAGGTVASSNAEVESQSGNTYFAAGTLINGRFGLGVKATTNELNEVTDTRGWCLAMLTQREYIRIEIGENDAGNTVIVPVLGTETPKFGFFGSNLSVLAELPFTMQSVNSTIETALGVQAGLMAKF